jgi:hypothetical protein
MRHPELLLPFGFALACGGTAANGAEQRVAPASARDSTEDPMTACAVGVLSASAFIERVGAARGSDQARTRYLALRNSPSRSTKSLAFTLVRSSELVVEYPWPQSRQDTSGMQPMPDQEVSDGEGAILADLSAALLRQVRDRCAPNAGGEVSCSRVAQGRGERCALSI